MFEDTALKLLDAIERLITEITLLRNTYWWKSAAPAQVPYSPLPHYPPVPMQPTILPEPIQPTKPQYQPFSPVIPTVTGPTIIGIGDKASDSHQITASRYQ